jgi:hypothetical protein
MNELCKGCQIKAAKSGSAEYRDMCIFVEYRQIDICPCKECLLKVMCSKTCDIRNKLRAHLLDMKRIMHSSSPQTKSNLNQELLRIAKGKTNEKT